MTSRMLKELKNLSPWQWDGKPSTVGPGTTSAFEKVGALAAPEIAWKSLHLLQMGCLPFRSPSVVLPTSNPAPRTSQVEDCLSNRSTSRTRQPTSGRVGAHWEVRVGPSGRAGFDLRQVPPIVQPSGCGHHQWTSAMVPCLPEIGDSHQSFKFDNRLSACSPPSGRPPRTRCRGRTARSSILTARWGRIQLCMFSCTQRALEACSCCMGTRTLPAASHAGLNPPTHTHPTPSCATWACSNPLPPIPSSRTLPGLASLDLMPTVRTR